MRALSFAIAILPLVCPAQPQRGVTPAPQATPVASKGAFYALVIGVNRYQHEPQLQTAVNDAKAVEAVLRVRYGFKTRLLLDADATRGGILGAFAAYRRTLNPDDELLIYYAGHGIRDGEKAYWLPVDAQPDNPAEWIISDDITAGIRVIAARQVLVVSDSCYSGALNRAAVVDTRPSDADVAIARMLETPSRILISSGRNEPVADSGAGGHSVFTGAFLNGLQSETRPAFTALTLFENYVREPVIGRSQQVPLYQIIQDSGHEGGDFVFFGGPAPPPPPVAPATGPPPSTPATEGATRVATAPSEPFSSISPIVLPTPPRGPSSTVAKPAKPTPIRLQEVSHKPNQITDTEKWFQANQLVLPAFQVPNPMMREIGNVPPAIPPSYQRNLIAHLIRGDGFLFGIYGPNYADGRYLAAFDAATDRPAWILDFANYLMPPEFVEADKSFITESINWAAVSGNVLYVSNFHDTYAKSSHGLNAYLNAFDLDTKGLLWRSKPLIQNASNFAIVDDAIIAGYGFTAETHFVYILDKRDGSIVQTIPVVKSPEYIIVKGNLVYIRTYDTDYVFKILNQAAAR